MKKILLGISTVWLSFYGANAQTPTKSVIADITSNTTFYNDTIYTLDLGGTGNGGFIYVKNNATLSIEPGTLIKGKKTSLVITRGAKINAVGTPNQPIVFTSYQNAGSRVAADWGGVLLLGKATINAPSGEAVAEGGIDATLGLYGGTDDTDSSGVMKYVRIEYAGIAFQPNRETNGLTMGGVGSKTVIDHIQVSYGGDDSFEWFGGTANAKHLVAYRGIDDDFDTDFGYRGNVQFGVGIRNIASYDAAGTSNGFESDNDGTGSSNTPNTETVFSNITIYGPNTTTTGTTFGRALHAKNNTEISIFNSLLTGYPRGLYIDGTGVTTNITNNDFRFKNNVIAGCATTIDSVNNTGIAGGLTNWLNTSNNSVYTNTADVIALVTDFNNPIPSLIPATSSALTTGASFSDSKLNNSFFTPVNYKGAFGAEDWTKCWTAFNTNEITYTSAPIKNYSPSINASSTSVKPGNIVNLAINGGAANYLWSNGATTPTIAITSPGVYSATLTSSAGCTDTTSITISQFEASIVNITSDISSNRTFHNDTIYLLDNGATGSGGFIYVKNNATLTIEPGTLIKSRKTALVITRGAKIIAEGTQTQPIVFTSNQPAGSRAAADCGGLLILGKAKVNVSGGETTAEGGIDATLGLYGGTDDADSSGVLKYVRIEYAGISFQTDRETNGLTMGGVGSKTVIDHVQISHGGDDSFEWFGGTVNAKHLIAHRGLDDDFDTDFGFTGKVQFAVALRDSSVSDMSSGGASNGFESDNDGTGSTNTPITEPSFSNITIIGPKRSTSQTLVGNGANFKRALHLRRNTRTSTYNSVFVGFPSGLYIDGSATAANINNNDLRFKNNVLAGINSGKTVDSANTSTLVTGGLLSWFNNNGNSSLTNASDVLLTDPFNYTLPNFIPSASSPLLTGASFTDSKLTNSFFENVSYKGAFGTQDWTKCWAEFNPNSQAYNNAPINYFPVAIVPSATTIGTGGSITLSTNATGAASFAWSNGATTASTTVNAPGLYTATITSTAGCIVNASVEILGVNIKEIQNINYINVYPNPLSNGNTANIDVFANKSTVVSVAIFDISGRMVVNTLNQKVDFGKNTLTVNTASLKSGMYFVNIIQEKGVVLKTSKLIIE